MWHQSTLCICAAPEIRVMQVMKKPSARGTATEPAARAKLAADGSSAEVLPLSPRSSLAAQKAEQAQEAAKGGAAAVSPHADAACRAQHPPIPPPAKAAAGRQRSATTGPSQNAAESLQMSSKPLLVLPRAMGPPSRDRAPSQPDSNLATAHTAAAAKHDSASRPSSKCEPQPCKASAPASKPELPLESKAQVSVVPKAAAASSGKSSKLSDAPAQKLAEQPAAKLPAADASKPAAAQKLSEQLPPPPALPQQRQGKASATPAVLSSGMPIHGTPHGKAFSWQSGAQAAVPTSIGFDQLM